MKSFRIVLNYARGFGFYSFLNIVFNILSAIFNLLTLLLFIPFLKLLFQDNDKPVVPVKPILDTSQGWLDGYKDYIGSYSNYLMDDYLFSNGKGNGLLYFCIFILVLFFLKKICTWLCDSYICHPRHFDGF